MFTLLAPLALAAAALLAIPVIIHLLKPKRVRTMPFSSLRWLRASQHKLSRRIQWHQILLFLLRAAFLTALVLALAKPILSTGGKRAFTERFIVLDVSRSMSYEQPGKDTPFQHGKKIARALLAEGLPGDRATVLLTATKTVALGPLAEDPTRYVARLEAARAGLADTDLTSALGVIRPMLVNPRPNARAEVVFITDNPQGGWAQGGIAAFTDGLTLPVTVKVFDVSPSAPRNAWIAGARLVEAGGRSLLQVRVGSSGNEAQERTVRVKQLPGLGNVWQKFALAPGAFAEVNLPVPADYDFSGKVAELVLEPRDALPDDDQFWLNLDARAAVRVLMVEPETTQVESLQPGHHLRAALGVIGQGEGGAIQITRRRPEAVAPADFATADVVVLANVGQLSDERLLALEQRIRSGAGLLLFLGPAVQPAFYNTKLHNPQRPTESLLPRPLQQPAHAAARGELARLTRIEWSHPLLAPLFDPTFGDFARLRARSFYLLGDAPPGDASQVLAWFEDAAPALIEHAFGAGRVLFVNSTANDEWSDLPRRNSFVPLLDQALNRLAGSRLNRNFNTGEMVALAVPGVGKNATANITTPSGRTVTPVIQQFDAQTIVRLDSADEAGVYALHARGAAGAAELKFVVHPGRGDSVVAKMDASTLRSWWGPTPFEVIHPDPAEKPEQTVATGRVLLWPWFFGLAALALLAEMYFVHRLCPVMNPAVAHSTVAQHGLLAPTAQPEVTR
jgi:hypothetical protein